MKYAIKVRFATIHFYDIKGTSTIRDMNKVYCRKFFAIGKMRVAMNVRIS